MPDAIEQLGPPPKEGRIFRAVVGLISVVGGLAGCGLLFFVAVPTGNRDALMLCLGIVLGWGGSVVASEYGASTTGRKMADLAVERSKQ